MSPQEYAEAVASEVRAEMGRQRKQQAELAATLEVTTATAGTRLSGAVPFDVIELAKVAHWLGIDLVRLTPSLTEAVSA